MLISFQKKGTTTSFKRHSIFTLSKEKLHKK
jgi:hypothetical protein